MTSVLEQNRKNIIAIQKSDPLNKLCADCGLNGTTFVDVKIGCFLCINCGGIHRKFGTDICRIKSINLDNFSTEELSVFTYTKGNAFVNKNYEGKLNDKKNIYGSFRKPTTSDDKHKIEDFIRRKYVTREFFIQNNETSIQPKQTKLVPNTSIKQLQKNTSQQMTQPKDKIVKQNIEDLISFDTQDELSPKQEVKIEQPTQSITQSVIDSAQNTTESNITQQKINDILNLFGPVSYPQNYYSQPYYQSLQK